MEWLYVGDLWGEFWGAVTALLIALAMWRRDAHAKLTFTILLGLWFVYNFLQKTVFFAILPIQILDVLVTLGLYTLHLRRGALIYGVVVCVMLVRICWQAVAAIAAFHPLTLEASLGIDAHALTLVVGALGGLMEPFSRAEYTLGNNVLYGMCLLAGYYCLQWRRSEI
ncbi:MAG: hypothetical protein AAF564_22215 [Bacteroidota bacterium]